MTLAALRAITLVPDPLADRLCGTGPNAPEGYSPLMISNGEFNMLVEW